MRAETTIGPRRLQHAAAMLSSPAIALSPHAHGQEIQVRPQGPVPQAPDPAARTRAGRRLSVQPADPGGGQAGTDVRPPDHLLRRRQRHRQIDAAGGDRAPVRLQRAGWRPEPSQPGQRPMDPTSRPPCASHGCRRSRTVSSCVPRASSTSPPTSTRWAREAQEPYGRKSLHAQSHGQCFFALFENRLRGARQAIYLLDEPEAALSPQRQIEFLGLLRRWEETGNIQVIIATHSPIIMSYPRATCCHSTVAESARSIHRDRPLPGHAAVPRWTMSSVLQQLFAADDPDDAE